jgi:hypothetical protein
MIDSRHPLYLLALASLSLPRPHRVESDKPSSNTGRTAEPAPQAQPERAAAI